MTNRTTVAWLFVILIPLIPVFILYYFFQNQNYFELTESRFGIYALGPIAAYVGLVLVGWYAYMRLERTGRLISPYFRELLGEWEMESTSTHKTVGKGKFQIDDKDGKLGISGNWQEGGVDIAQWESEFTGLRDHTLYIYYEMRQTKEGDYKNLEGMCRLNFGSKPITEMKGIWSVIGEEFTHGRMTCKKVSR